MGRASHAWKDFERKIAKGFEEAFGFEVRRSPISGGWARGGRGGARDAFDTKGDLVAPKDKPFCFLVECKRRKSWDIQDLFLDRGEVVKWWRDTKNRATTAEKIPLLITSVPKRRLAMVVMPSKFYSDCAINGCTIRPVLKVQGKFLVAIMRWETFQEWMKKPEVLDSMKQYWKQNKVH